MRPVLIELRIASGSPAGRSAAAGFVGRARAHARWTVDVRETARVASTVIGVDDDPSGDPTPRCDATVLADLATGELRVRVGAARVRVRPDPDAAGRLAADAAVGTGASHLALVGCDEPEDGEAGGGASAVTLNADPLAAVVRDRLAAAAGRSVVAGPPRAGSFREWVDWAAGVPKPCAAVARSAAGAFRLLEAARAAGVRVPDDLHVAAADGDDPLAPLALPSLARVDRDWPGVGRRAAAELARLLEGGSASPAAAASAPTTVLVPPAGLVPGDSLRPASGADPLVRRAAELMAARLAGPVSVPDLAAALGVSRRTLELRFAAARGTSPADEVRRLRVERACALLRDTDRPVADVAAACGFTAVELLQRAVRRQTGVTPSAYRKRHRVPSG